MENISEALKMAGAALLFVLAFTVTLMLFNQAQATADSVLFSADKTNFYEHIEPNSTGVTRSVGIETIIPTLYRYKQEGFTVKILDASGNELQVFDGAIESMIASNNGSSDTVLSNKLTSEEYNNYKKYNNPNEESYMAGAQWATGDTNNSKLLERINSYIYGTENSFENLNYDNNNLMELSNDGKIKFNESYLEYNTSGKYKSDSFGNWFTIVDGEQKVIITYTVK